MLIHLDKAANECFSMDLKGKDQKENQRKKSHGVSLSDSLVLLPDCEQAVHS